MSDAASVFVGEHDFASFARPGHGRESTIRAIHVCELHARGPKLVIGRTVGAGHFNMLEVPDQVNPMISRFLQISGLASTLTRQASSA